MSYRQWNVAIIPTATRRTGSRLAAFQARRIAWEAAGCSADAAEALAQSEIDGVDQISSLRPGFFECVPNCDPATVVEINCCIGGWPGKPEMTPGSSAIEVIAAAGRVMIDMKVEYDDAAGVLCRDHAFAGLSLAEAVKLVDALNNAITAAMNSDPRQASLWPVSPGSQPRAKSLA